MTTGRRPDAATDLAGGRPVCSEFPQGTMTGPFTFTVPRPGHEPDGTWAVTRLVTTTGTLTTQVVLTNTADNSYVQVRANFTEAGLTLNPTKKHWAPFLTAQLQTLLHDIDVARTLVRAEVAAIDAIRAIDDAQQASGGMTVIGGDWDLRRHQRQLLVAAYDIDDPIGRTVALASIAAGYTGPVQDLLASAHAAAAPAAGPTNP